MKRKLRKCAVLMATLILLALVCGLQACGHLATFSQPESTGESPSNAQLKADTSHVQVFKVFIVEKRPKRDLLLRPSDKAAYTATDLLLRPEDNIIYSPVNAPNEISNENHRANRIPADMEKRAKRDIDANAKKKSQ